MNNQQKYEYAVKLLDNKKYSESYKIMKEFENTNNAEVLLKLTVINYQLKDYEKALHYINICFKLCSLDKRIYYNKALILLKLNREKEAINLLYFIVKIIDSNYIQAYTLLLGKGETDEDNEIICQRLIELGTKNSYVYIQYGFYLIQSNFKKAMKMIQTGLIKILLQDHWKLVVERCEQRDIINKYGLHHEKSYGIIRDVFTKEEMVNVVISVFLMSPKIYSSKKEIMEHRKGLKSRIEYLLKNIPAKTYKTIDQLYTSIPNTYVFPLSYYGLNNSKLFKSISKLFLHLCPDLNYISANIDISHNDKKKRIGFISENIDSNHSVAKDRLGIIRLLSRTKFTVFGFMFKNPSEKLGNIMYTSFDKCIILEKNNLTEIRKIIESLNLDVLVYCDLGMSPKTYYLAHSRLAKIQLTTWGHSDTSGIENIDYYVSSKYYETEKAQNYYSEKLIKLDSLCTFYYNPLITYGYKECHQLSRNALGLSTKYNIYFCPHSLFKLHPSFDAIIKNILKKDKNGLILFIRKSSAVEAIMNRFDKTMNANQLMRIRFLEKKNVHYYYHYIVNSDVILDTHPFGGCNTSLESFALKKPVVTLPSNTINGRFTYGFYNKIGVTDLIAKNNKDYVNIAIKLTTDKEYCKKIVDKIAEKSDSLFNEHKSVSDWENMLESLIDNDNNVWIT